ncbi:ABC transporter permease [Rhodanobacter aciditrophus]|uniref:ABC transporter permease n=1 Tax=Rhodanobacter aciditrophus TaxID=1623218 RepID=A0ABW4B142_9GAMM
MTTLTSTSNSGRDWSTSIKANQGLLLSMVFFFSLMVVTALVNGRAPSYFTISMLLASVAPLALAAIGQTVIVIGGGLDLSVGAVVAFSQAVMVIYFAELGLPVESLIVIGVVIGMLAGMINGFFVSVVGLQPIIVTLATMFTLQGVTYLVLPQPGGMVPDELIVMLLDDTIYDVLPGPLTVLVVALVIWWVIRNTSLGTSIYAAGSDGQSAKLAGLNVKRGVWASYIIGGGFYGAAGVMAASLSGAADPTIGTPLLVSSLTAVMLGGTLLGGGRGSALGSVMGALTVIAMVNLLLAFGAPNYLSAGIEALILLLAVIINRPRGESANGGLQRMLLSIQQFSLRSSHVAKKRASQFNLPPISAWLPKSDRKYMIPAWVGVVVISAIAMMYYGEDLETLRYIDRLLLLGAFLSVLVLGQGVVVMSGGFDLSVGWVVSACGVVGAMIMQGSDANLLIALPVVLLLGAFIGLINGVMVSVVGLSPIVATLAIGGLLQSFTMFVSGGTPSGTASPALIWLINGSILGMAPLSLLIFVFVVFGVLFTTCTAFGRRLISVGSNAEAAFLSGVNVSKVTIKAYVVSGVCAAIAGMLLTGFLGRASLSLGDSYLLPTVAAVAIGGTLISGGRGHYLGMFGGALALTALQILLSGTPLPTAVRDIMLGLAVLMAVVTLREK